MAHTTSISYSEIQIQEKQIQLKLRLNLYEFSVAPQLDRNSDRFLSEEEVKNGLSGFLDQLFANIRVQGQGETGRPHLDKFKFVPDTGELECFLVYSFSQIVEEVDFKVTLHNLTDSGHLNLALLQYGGQQEQRFFNLENSEARLVFHRGWMSILKLGVRLLVMGGKRILSYDTLSFLVGLLLVVQSLSNRVKSVAAFLFSQTATSWVGAFNIVVLPPRFVDSAIALSVTYIAIENLLLKEITYRWIVAGFFGLIYGFSFSLSIREWGAPNKGMLGSLVTLNLGAVLAVSFVAIMASLTFSYLNRLRWEKQFSTIVSWILMSMGSFWFIRRTF